MNIFYDANKIYEAGTKAIKSAPFKYQSQLFEVNHLLLTAELQRDIKEWKYKPTKGSKFTINERGKIRNITTNDMIDKTVNHLICDNVLTPAITPYLIYDNGASQKNKGVSFHRKRLEVHLHQYYRKHKSNEGYILLIDFSKYYASIPHNLCLENLQSFLKKVNKEEAQITLWILKNVFNVFNAENKNGRGVDIGSQPSQNIGIAYPSRIDNYIKIVKGIKYYGRYTDDMYLIHESKEYLKEVFKPFTREETSLTDAVQGTGLGMAITKNLIDLMGGTIKVLSTQGVGTTYEVTMEFRIADINTNKDLWNRYNIQSNYERIR